MKRFALIAAMFAVTACNNAEKEKARQDSISAAAVADSTAKAVEAMRVADSVKAAEEAAKAATQTKTKGTKTK